MFISVRSFGEWTSANILNNGIQQADQNPLFVEEYERILGTKRKVPNNVCHLLIAFLSDFLTNELRCSL